MTSSIDTLAREKAIELAQARRPNGQFGGSTGGSTASVGDGGGVGGKKGYSKEEIDESMRSYDSARGTKGESKARKDMEHKANRGASGDDEGDDLMMAADHAKIQPHPAGMPPSKVRDHYNAQANDFEAKATKLRSKSDKLWADHKAKNPGAGFKIVGPNTRGLNLAANKYKGLATRARKMAKEAQ